MPAVATTPYEQHRDYVLAVLARRCRWLEPDEREATLHDAYTVFLQKQRDGVLDVEGMRPQQVRAYLTQTAINKAMDDGNRARRTRSVALEDSGGLEVADQHPEVVERLEQGYDAARVREIVEDLPPRQQVVVKLRFFLDMSPTEIQEYLGVTERVYRRELERAMRALSDHVDLVRRGTSCDQRRSLILAYVAGIAGPNRVQVARRHLASCPGCAAWAGRLRTAAHQAGAVVPLPLGGEIIGADDRWWAGLGHGLGHLRDKALDMLSGGREHVTGLVVRTDPSTTTVLGAARPGAVAAVVAGCLTVGGTTYCAVDGVTTPLGGLLSPSRSHTSAPRPSTTPRPAPQKVAMKRPETPAANTATTAAARASSSRTHARATSSRASTTATSSASTPASKASTPTARRVEQKAASEFGVEGGGSTATASAASAPATSSSSGTSSSGGGASEAAVAAEFGP